MPTILLKKSDTPGSVPGTANLTNLAGGAEVAVNTADKRMFSMTSASAVIELGTNPSSLTCADASFTVARVGSLTISSLSLTNATVTSATVTTLTGTSANITTVTGTTAGFSSANITQLQSTSATITTLTSTSANITTVSGTTATYTSATITNLNATSFTLSNLSIASANITTLTSASATITNLLATTLTVSGNSFLATSSGNVGIGGTADAASRMEIVGTAPSSGGITRGVRVNHTIPSSTTTTAAAFTASNTTAAASFTLTNAYGFSANGIGIGAGSSITNMIGFIANDNIVTGTNNYGFYSNIASGSNRWNFYAAGTADNYFAGNVGIGTTTLNQKATIWTGGTLPSTIANCQLLVGDTTGFANAGLALTTAAGNGSAIFFGSTATPTLGRITYDNTSNYMELFTNSSARMRIDSSGNVGIGSTSPVSVAGYNILTLNGSTGGGWYLQNNGTSVGAASVNSGGMTFGTVNSTPTLFITSATERMRIDSSGNVGIGTASFTQKLAINSANTSTNSLVEYKQGDVTQAYVGMGSDNKLRLEALSTDVGIQADSANVIFFNTNGSERMRISSGGTVSVATTSTAPGTANVVGVALGSAGYVSASRDSAASAEFNRKTNDGDIIVFEQDGTQEGSISVSGNTISYNAFAGSHWSQLQDGSKPDILRGTVMESINELCVWPDENNERLPKSKVSGTTGSKKVYGVFMAWDNDWTATNDMLITSVGAFICRVNGSVTVQEGDLLESNGDGTARVQADDIIRSSTIGKVTSTVKTHQYADGSYCVPTVLYCG